MGPRPATSAAITATLPHPHEKRAQFYMRAYVRRVYWGCDLIFTRVTIVILSVQKKMPQRY